jgi:hypothetical protein
MCSVFAMVIQIIFCSIKYLFKIHVETHIGLHVECTLLLDFNQTGICKIVGSHSSGYEEYYILGYNAVKFVECRPTFQRNISPPSLAELCLPSAVTLVSCTAYFSTMKMEAIYSSETSVDTQQTIWPYIPEDGTLQIGICRQDLVKLCNIKFHENPLTYS